MEPIQIIFLGDHNVGKTTIIQTLIKGSSRQKPQVTTDIKEYQINRTNLSLIVIDTPGNASRINAINRQLKNRDDNYDVAILVFDVSQKNTLYNLANWSKILDGKANKTVVIAHKCDLSPYLSSDEAIKLSKTLGASAYYQTSSKLENIPQPNSISQIIKDIYSNVIRNNNSWKESKLSLNIPKKPSSYFKNDQDAYNYQDPYKQLSQSNSRSSISDGSRVDQTQAWRKGQANKQYWNQMKKIQEEEKRKRIANEQKWKQNQVERIRRGEDQIRNQNQVERIRIANEQIRKQNQAERQRREEEQIRKINQQKQMNYKANNLNKSHAIYEEMPNKQMTFVTSLGRNGRNTRNDGNSEYLYNKNGSQTTYQQKYNNQMYENHPIMQKRPSINSKQTKNPQNDYFVGNYYPTPVAVPPAFYPQNNETQLVSRYTQPVNSLYGNHRPQPINYQIQTDSTKKDSLKPHQSQTIKSNRPTVSDNFQSAFKKSVVYQRQEQQNSGCCFRLVWRLINL